MDYKQLKEFVVIPTLKQMDLYSESAANLIIGTMAQESRCEYLKQIGGGPACGLIQMEPATHLDIYLNYLRYKVDLMDKVTGYLTTAEFESIDKSDSRDESLNAVAKDGSLVWNIAYQVAMCRVHYLRKKPAIPPADDIEALGRYWKEHYNTNLGKGTVAEFVENFPREIL